MTNARDARLRRFATAKFVESNSSEDAYEESEISLNVLRVLAGQEGGDFQKTVRNSLAEAAALVEQRGWLAIGGDIGCFETPPLEEADRAIILEAAESAGEVWPRWFGRFAAHLGRGDMSGYIPEMLRGASSATVAIFQAAFILADEFKNPLLVALHRSLHYQASPLDSAVEEASGEEVFQALETSNEIRWKDLRSPQRFPRLIAGFLQLVDILAAFDALFPADATLTITPKEETPRDALSRLTANLLMWRLNLWSEAVVRRLQVVAEGFWDLCRREFSRYPDLSVRWSPPEARAELLRLLDRWRDRADPEPDSPKPDLSKVAGLAERSFAFSSRQGEEFDL